MNSPKEIQGVFMIADLSGYAALTEAHGDMSAARVVGRYVEIVENSLQPGAYLAERVGDEVLVISPQVDGVLRTAVKLRDEVEKEPFFPTLHAGIHAGGMLEENGHFFGTALNLTSRLAAHAKGEQILCTREVVDLASGIRDIEFRALGVVQFKNISKPVAIFEVVSALQRTEQRVIDPVCRMQVTPGTAPAMLPFRGSTYYFCCFECAKIFAEHPDRYVED